MTIQQNNTCKVVVIDPANRSVYEKQISNENTLQEWYDTIGNGCNLVTSATSIQDEGDVVNSLLMDDEILLRPDDIHGAFSFGGRFYFNTAIFSGVDENGETCDTTIVAEDLLNRINWLDQQSAILLAQRYMEQPIKIISF